MRLSILNIFIALIAGMILVISPSPANADNISFNYQGRVKVGNEPFQGTGLLKFAILNTSGTSVLWSNDGTVGVGTGPNDLPVPTQAVGLQVTNGVFSVMIGDETIPGMEPLDSAVMVSNSPLRLRVWFSNGDLGFQKLSPDYKLIDLTLSKIQTGTSDFTIYVNAESGNDANNGLTVETPKKTISGAVDILPEKIRCNITVSIAPGVYREIVTPHGLSVAYGNTVTFTGDTAWVPSLGGAPAVIIDAADTGDTPLREFCMYARQCTGLVIEGITFQNARSSGLKLENGTYTINRCVARGSIISKFATGHGFQAGPQCYATFNQSMATQNESIGFCIDSSSRAYLTTCTATFNEIGVFTTSNSVSQFFSYNNFSNNAVGVQANTLADCSVWPSSSDATRTHIQNNSQYGALVNWSGQFTPADAILSGNDKRFLRYYGTIIGVDQEPTQN